MFWRKKRSQADFDEEIRAHLELDAAELEEQGLRTEEAQNTSRRAFGNVTATQERFYERSRYLWWDHLIQDVHYALRGLHRNPVFTIAAIATLALGIGANAAIFSVVRAVLLKPLPYANPERIVVLAPFYKNTGKTGTVVSAPDFHDWRSQNRVFDFMAYYYGDNVTVIANGVPSFTKTQVVTSDFFHVFGLSPEVGRFWSEQENRKPLAIVSHNWAREQFGDAAAAIGKTIRANGKVVEIIGVAAPGFHYPDASNIWISAGLFPENPYRSGHNYFAIAKRKANVSLAEAQSEMRSIGDRLEQQYPGNRFKTVAVTPLAEKLTSSAKTTLWVLLGAVFGVLLIACGNVANLQLARATSRSREMAVRAALGARRSRILCQVLTESAVLGSIGALIGLVLAWMLLKALLSIAPVDIPRLDEVRIDGAVLLFSLIVAGVCSVLFGLAPARRSSNPDLSSRLTQNSTRGSIGSMRSRMRSILVIAEVALSVILLAGAGLLLRSFVALTHVDLGFSPNRLLLTDTSITGSDENEARRATEFQRDLIDRVRLLPGVHRVAGARTKPFAAIRSTVSYSIDGGPKYRHGEEPNAQVQVVTPGYFETMGIPIQRGRNFSSGDAWERPQVVIVNEALAREAFGSENPIGHWIRCGMSQQSGNGMEVIGVVRDARQVAPGELPKAELFLPYLQHPFAGSNLTMIVQTNLEPQSLSTAIRQTVTNMNPETPVRFSTMDEVVSKSLAYPRFRAVLIGCFAALAACLSVVGIYGVISYLVGQRTNEIGLRMALGARSADVFRLVIGGSMRLVACGLVLGLIGTIALSGVLRSLLFGVGPYDLPTLFVVLITLGVAALCGSAIPALRAAKVDPLLALRQD